MRRPGAFLLALLLAGPPASVPQESSSAPGLAGNWEGSARLTNDWPGHPCRYDTPEEVSGAEVGEAPGSGEPTGVRLALEVVDGDLRGSVAIDIPAAEGSGCPPLRKRHLVTEVVLGAGVVNLTDSGGHDWDLALSRNRRVLRGMMSWQQGGPEESLAQRFSFPDGTRPGSRLSGEVRLRKVVPPPDESAAAGDGAAGASAAPQTTSAGTHFKHVGIVLGATAVGLAGLYGVNQLGQGSSEGGTITCSPRHCVVGAPNEPCFCEGNVVSGSPCGETETGVEIGGQCSVPDRPCQALLSCNNGICQDRFGSCPFN